MHLYELMAWKRALNELKFKHEEMELIKEYSGSAASAFQTWLEEYAKKNGFDLQALNRKREERLQRQKQNAPQEQKVIEDKQGNFEVGSYEGSVVAQEQEKPEFENDEKDSDEIHEVFRRLFKQIAIYLHPDKIQNLSQSEQEERIEAFKKAKMAFDEQKYFYLLELSERFNIRMPKNYKQQTRWMKNKLKEVNFELNTLKNTYNYLFAECETDADKDKLVRGFIKQVFNV